MVDMTAIILTKNEEKNIEDCINSIKSLCSRIIVIDSFSNDKTCEIAKELDADIYYNDFINYAKQFKFGLYNTDINTEWVLRIDADERLTEEAIVKIEEIIHNKNSKDVTGLIIRFEQKFLGKQLRHGGNYPFKKLIIFKREFGDIEDSNMDEHIVLTKGKTKEIKCDCIHLDDKGLSQFINKHNWYSDREVKDYFIREKETQIERNIATCARIKRIIKYKFYYKLPAGLRAWLYYIYRYYILLGFLDGREGKIYIFLQAYWYRFLVDSKIYEQKKSFLLQEGNDEHE